MPHRHHSFVARGKFRVLALLTAFAIFFSLSFAASTNAGEPSVEVFKISKNRHFERVEALMNQSVADRVEVRVEAGSYRLRDTFHVARSNVALIGEPGVVLRLAKRIERPVIAIGSQKDYPTEADRIVNVSVSDLEIDGNKAAQRSEYDRELPWIRNNGIDVRTVSGLLVERVASSNNRSGGLVISWRCRDVLVRDCRFERNYFDGVAYYDSERVFTVDCLMRENLGAGVSLDNAFVDSIFARCRLESNRDVGVFARSSERLVFFDCDVADSGNWAIFLSHDDKGHGVFDVDIASCRILRNHGGVRIGSVTEVQSSRNSVSATLLADNGLRGRPELSSAGSRLLEFEDAWGSSGAIALEGEATDPNFVSPYVEQVDQAILAIETLNRS